MTHVGGRKVWRRFDTRKGHSAKRRLVRKLLSSYIITLMLLMSFSIIFVSTGLARLSSPSDVSGDDLPGGALRILPPPVVGDIPDQTVLEGDNFIAIILDDYVDDPNNDDGEMIWTYSGNMELIVAIVDRVATISVPGPEWNGAETITFNATNPLGSGDEDSATFTVTSVNDPPVVGDIPDQTIEEGESFATINLDNYVDDPDNLDSELTWTVFGNVSLIVDINAGHVVTITPPSLEWNGAETITFNATDPLGLGDEDSATFTVTAEENNPLAVPLELPNEDGSSVTTPVPAPVAPAQVIDGENVGYVTGHLEEADTNFGSGYSLSTIYITPENQEETGVFSIEFTPATYLTDVDATVVKLDAESLGIPVISGEGIAIFGYLDINLVANGTSIEEDAINSLYFKFKINKTWIQENNIDNETITLMRYHNGSWQELNTTIDDENDTYFYFEAAAPGCGSTFAIIGTEVVEVQPYLTQPQGIPWTVIAGFIIAASIVLVITLFKAEYIYTEDKHNTDESEKKSNRKTNNKLRLQLVHNRFAGDNMHTFQRKTRCLLSALQVHMVKFTTFLISSSVSIVFIVTIIS